MKRIIVLVFPVLLLLGSCGKEGCTDPLAENYDVDANVDKWKMSIIKLKKRRII